MGETEVAERLDRAEIRSFTRAILNDLEALEQILDSGRIETGVRRIGAEQEMFIVDASGGPAPLVMEVLEDLDPATFTTELARFNLEANLPPMMFAADCLSRLQKQLDDAVAAARKAANKHGGDILLTGILPTIKRTDLTLENMTPLPRYRALSDTIRALRGGDFRTQIKGVDELNASHDNILLEACNTSFQIHFQVAPDEFAHLYNLAQAVTAPVLAAGVNSPVLLQHRLWRETRIALFQQSIDMRRSAHLARGERTRVHFGDRWVNDSVMEIFREDVARFRVMLTAGVEEDSLELLEQGQLPSLKALCLHNGTIYRWNRPCYGVADGVAHLRIENRVLPAGPTPLDEVANAAFYFGLMSSVSDEYGEIEVALSFDDAKANFLSAARHGLRAQFTWADGRTYKAGELILDQLLPLAREGLRSKELDSSDIDRYLGVIEERVRTECTGAQWMLKSLASMEGQGSREERFRALSVAALERCKSGRPVHEWPLAELHETEDWRHSYQYVEQVMSQDIFTVRPDDIADLAAAMMDWEHIRHVPVEDDHGHLVGLVSHRQLLRLVVKRASSPKPAEPPSVEQIMTTELLTVTPGTKTVEAIKLMRRHNVGCLPVVEQDGHLVGIVTEVDLLKVAAAIMEEQLDAD